VRAGNVTLTQLLAAGATQYGAVEDDYGAGCPDTGNGCKAFYAVSIPGVLPSTDITWFQAAAACRNSGKRLPTNQEWQMAALGTPDKGGADDGLHRCNVSFAGTTVPTGSRAKCVSDTGVFDLIGNTEEWVADWVPKSNVCIPALFPETSDSNCMGAIAPGGGVGALTRGGDFSYHEFAGVFAVESNSSPTFGGTDNIRGFRCAF
jgi:formylglycine-generating enzyme required for sulfatase activity